MMLFFVSAWAAVGALILTLFPMPGAGGGERLAVAAFMIVACGSAWIWLMLGMRIVRDARE
jgi:hypothetical protein